MKVGDLVEFKQRLEELGSVSTHGLEIAKYAASIFVERVVMMVPVFDSVALSQRLSNEHQRALAQNAAVNQEVFGVTNYQQYEADAKAQTESQKAAERDRKAAEALQSAIEERRIRMPGVIEAIELSLEEPTEIDLFTLVDSRK